LYSQADGTVIFSLTTKGVITYLATIQDPPYILESVPVGAANGLLYASYESVSNTGGSANVFSVGAGGGMQVYPAQSLPISFSQNLPEGTLLGTAYQFSNALWDVARSDLAGNVTSVYQFTPTESAHSPYAPIYATDGNYYGLAALEDGSGYVYRLTPSGSITTLYSFPPYSFGQSAVLLQGRDGNLYGITSTGGANQSGTVYKVTMSGQYTLLYTFPKSHGRIADNLIEGSDGELYGSTVDGGASLLFRVSKAGRYEELYRMNNASTDGECGCALLQGSDGIIYGTTIAGGPNGGSSVFALDAGLPKPAPQALEFRPKTGPAGTKVQIWGYNLLSATVEFNGLAAADVSNSGSNYVRATVPAGATSGPITVTTPGDMDLTRERFTVR
jgi:uncharacterized repeat protein (TIGR03803 family)